MKQHNVLIIITNIFSSKTTYQNNFLRIMESGVMMLKIQLFQQRNKIHLKIY